MTASVRVLTTRTLDSSPALLLIEPDGSKTLINCGEGCQRSFLEHSQKLSSVNRICLTHLAHDSIGGLPGSILTTADAAKAAQVDLMASDSNNNTHNHGGGRGKNPRDNVLPLQGLELYGPVGTAAYIRSLRFFVRRDDFPINIKEGKHTVPPASSQMDVQRKRSSKKLKRQRDENASSSTGAESDPQETSHYYFGVQTIPVDYQIPFPTNTTKYYTDQQRKSQAISYLFSTPPVAGKFLPDKAKELGIPPGPLYAKLKAGQTVTFTDAEGTEQKVESSQVVLEPSAGMMVAILYYPTLEVWEGLQPQLDGTLSKEQPSSGNNNNEQQKKKKNGTTESGPPMLELVVHMTTIDLLNHETCQAWREQLGRQQQQHGEDSTIHHLFVETSDPAMWNPPAAEIPSPFLSACVGAMVRSQIHSEVYQIPDFLKSAAKSMNHEASTTSSTSTKEHSNTHIQTDTPLLEYVVMPKSRRGFTAVESSNKYLDDRRHQALEELTQSGALERAKDILSGQPNGSTNDDTADNNNSTCQAALSFTGTGSAIPCKHRNVTGMSLKMEDGQVILLDVGEGTIGQLLRALPLMENESLNDHSAAAANLLLSIKAVWVSHPHADHHLGLLRLLTDRQAAISHCCAGGADNLLAGIDSDPVVVIGPPPILDFLKEYEVVDSRIACSYRGLDCRELISNPNRPRASSPQVMQENSLLGGQITSVQAIPVAHCPYSYAVVLEGTAFGKVAYSGDCRPSHKFAQQAQNADILIHEATFEDGMEAEAAMKRHCTVGEALSIAHEMKAKHLVLTHFSQRYPKIPPLLSNAEGDDKSSSSIPVIFAFDFMSLTKKNLDVASVLTPALRCLYPEKAEEEPAKEDPAAMSVPGFFANNPYD